MSYVMGQMAVGLLIAWLSGFVFGFLIKAVTKLFNAVISNESE